MVRSLPLFAAAALFAAASLFSSDQQTADAQTKSAAKSKFKAPTRPTNRIFRVQARSPYWRAVTIAPNPQIAHRIRRHLERRGWQVQTRRNYLNQVAIRARVVHWYTKAIYNNRPQAERTAAFFRYSGLQARIR